MASLLEFCPAQNGVVIRLSHANLDDLELDALRRAVAKADAVAPAGRVVSHDRAAALLHVPLKAHAASECGVRIGFLFHTHAAVVNADVCDLGLVRRR